MSNTATYRNPRTVPLCSPLSPSEPSAALATIGARIQMAFSPLRTDRPSFFHALKPATLLASGHWAAMSTTFPKL